MDDILLNPNIAYLLLMAGSLLGLLALAAPGTGALEIGSLFCLVLAGYAVTRLEFNWWTLILLVLSLVPFLYAIQRPKREIFLALSILGLTLSSAYLFRNPELEGGPAVNPFIPVVNPFIALVSSVLYAGFVWIAVRKSVQAFHAPPTHNLETLIGQLGEAKTLVHTDGSVQVGGELWSARSKEPIRAGDHVRVLGREGFILDVEPDPGQSKK